ncbi:MAG: GNAT family N-acetyltransferase, partial [Lachnospiraceae bacterium]|nr:GNAT family N-acetyltransferase [Lachnospiraceae bacterium]
MDTDIKKIEDLSLNAWPSHQMQMYDGWILRFSYFYTHRTNCAEAVGMSLLPLAEKIEYCERIYRRWKTPCIFKISPICDPALDGILAERGYRIEHMVDNMTAVLPAAQTEDAEKGTSALSEHGLTLEIADRVSREWVDGLFSLKHTTDPVHIKIVPSMYDAIPMDEIAVSLRDADGRIAGTGLGILDRDYIGIY